MNANPKSAIFLLVVLTCGLSALCLTLPVENRGQEAKNPAGPVGEKHEADVTATPPRKPAGEHQPIVISDQPKQVDPATFYPEKLTKPVTVEFLKTPLVDVAKWLENELSLIVVIDAKSLSDFGISTEQPITDRLDQAPPYLLLNRLSKFHLTWTYDEGAIIILGEHELHTRQSTVCHNVRDLLDNGYLPQDIPRLIKDFVPGAWNEDAGGGRVSLLGDVLFVRQDFRSQCVVSGLLSAMRKHGRRTLIFDPPQNEVLRERLNQTVEVDFTDVPLVEGFNELTRQTEVQFRFNEQALTSEGIGIESPVTIRESGRSLAVVLHRILTEMRLTWQVTDGVVVITTINDDSKSLQTAVFDVRDLCHNRADSENLVAVIQSQTSGQWLEVDALGGRIESPKPGVLVVSQTRHLLDEISALLEKYRKSGPTAKPRLDGDEGLLTIVTRFYRLPQPVAIDAQRILPRLVAPESWKSASNAEAPGTIDLVESLPKLVNPESRKLPGREPRKNSEKIEVPMSVLVIRQTRTNHREIDRQLKKIQTGDARSEIPRPAAANTTQVTGWFGDEIPIRIVQLDDEAIREFKAGPYELDFSGPKFEFNLVNSYLYGPDDDIISKVQRCLHEGTGVGFFGPAHKQFSWTGEAVVAISADRLRDRMLVFNDDVADEWNFIGTFAYSPTELGVVIRSRAANDGTNDVVFIWNLSSDLLKRSELHSRLWKIHDAIDHGGALKVDEGMNRTRKVTLIGAVTNRTCELPLRESQFHQMLDRVWHSHLGISTTTYYSFYLPTAEATSLIFIPEAEFLSHGKFEILCIDPGYENGIRWRHDQQTLGREIVPVGSELHVVCGVSRPTPTLDILCGQYKSGFAIYNSLSTATGAVNRSLRLAMSKEWGDASCDPATISKNGRWLALISRNSENDYSLRIYDLEHDGQYRELPIAQKHSDSWSRYRVVGIRNNENIVLQCEDGYWEVGLETAQVRQRIFELPRKTASIE